MSRFPFLKPSTLSTALSVSYTLERVFSVLNKGETKKRRKKMNVYEQTAGKGGGRPGGTTEKEKKRGPKGRNSAENATCT